jgi:heptosyltransferase-2
LRLKNFGIVWVGLRSIPIEIKQPTDIDLSGATDIKSVAWVLSQMRLLVCNDSGLMHLAEACGVPVVGIFGPTSKELGFAPSLKKSRIVEKDLWCRPCSKTGRACLRLTDRYKCLNLISSEDVLGAVTQVVSAGGFEK